MVYKLKKSEVRNCINNHCECYYLVSVCRNKVFAATQDNHNIYWTIETSQCSFF